MEKIKQFLESEKGKGILMILVVILVGAASFELGRLSKSGSSSGIKIEYDTQQANAVSAVDSVITNSTNTNKTKIATQIVKPPVQEIFFASKRGHKYYPLGCSAGKTILQENRIYFNTSKDAENLGYTLSASCK